MGGIFMKTEYIKWILFAIALPLSIVQASEQKQDETAIVKGNQTLSLNSKDLFFLK